MPNHRLFFSSLCIWVTCVAVMPTFCGSESHSSPLNFMRPDAVAIHILLCESAMIATTPSATSMNTFHDFPSNASACVSFQLSPFFMLYVVHFEPSKQETPLLVPNQTEPPSPTTMSRTFSPARPLVTLYEVQAPPE